MRLRLSLSPGDYNVHRFDDTDESDCGPWNEECRHLYAYDFADRPATLDVDPATGTPEPVVTSSSYLPSGPLSTLGLGNGTTETRIYDGRYAPEEILLDASRPHRWTYATDGVGNVTEITEETGCLEADLVLANQTVTIAEAFESCAAIEAGPAFAVEAPGDVTLTAGTRVVLRDGFSVGSGARLVAGVDPALAGGTETKTFQYQIVQYFLTGAELPWTTLDWSYDRIGNRLTETRDGLTDTYAYVANGSSGNTALLDQVTLGVGGTRDYTFGAAGHLEEVAAGANVVDFVSDGEGRLSEVARTGGSSSPFVYDGRSFLSRAGDLATVGTTRPAYSSDGRVMALRRQASTAEPELTNIVLYFAGRPVAQLEMGGRAPRWSYFTVDHLGTPQVATDEAGAELWAASFEPFGEDSARGTPGGALENGVFLRLPGQWETETWQDAALGAGVYYNVHRWYGPGNGKYTKADPLSLAGDINLYRYAVANPVRYRDRLGQQADSPLFFLRDPNEYKEELERLEECFSCPCGPMPPIPPVPPGVNLATNIETASDHFMNIVWFYNQVRNRGPWDYKQIGQPFEDFGNFNFGLTGRLCGLNLRTLERGAGWAQQRAGTSGSGPDFGEPGILFNMLGGERPFGDDIKDNRMIRGGARFFGWLRCVQTIELEGASR